MDFKFHSMEERSSNYFSSSPKFPNPNNVNNISYFTHQAIRAGFTSPDPIRREFNRNPNPNPNDMRESIQRELEKERIRAEILAEEIYRRRMLEDEVRRELMYERKMAMRRGEGEFGFGSSMRFEPRVPLLANFEHRIGVSPHRDVGFQGSQTLPFQRDPVIAGDGNGNGNGFSLGVRLKEIKEIKGSSSETNKDKVIFLAKPNATDLKRKATTPPIETTVDPCTVSKKPKSKDEWSCALCRVTATSKRALDDHLQGKKHKARESGLSSQRTGFGTGPLPKMGNTSTGKPIKVPGATNSPSVRRKEVKEGSESSLGKIDNAPAQSGTDNKMTLLQDKLTCIDTNEKEAAIPKKSPARAKLNNKFKFFCETCQVGAYSVKVMNAHTKGKRHLAKVVYINQTEKATSGETPEQKGAVEENKDNNKESDMAGFVEKAVVEEKKELEIVAVEEIKNEIEGEQVESNKENIDFDEDVKKELDIAAAEEIKMEIEMEQVERNKENIDCEGAVVEDDDGNKVLECVGGDVLVAEKDDNQ